MVFIVRKTTLFVKNVVYYQLKSYDDERDVVRGESTLHVANPIMSN